jgi:N4-gp56 family major capsid protein
MANNFDPIFAEVWGREVERAAEPALLLRQWCVIKEDLVANPGDTIWVPKFEQLTGSGIAEANDMEGNESDYNAYALGLVPAEVKNAVKVKKSDLEKTPVALRQEVATALGNWYARKEDSDIWTAAVDDAVANVGLYNGTTVTTQVIYGGDATSRATVDSTDTFSCAVISKAAGKLAANNTPKFVLGGIACYVGLISPQQAYDLKQTSDWKSAQWYSGIQGSSNAIFTGAIGMYNGVLLFETTQVSTSTGWGCPAGTVYQGVVFGPRALCLAFGQHNKWAEKEFDYGTKVGMATYSRYMAHILNYKNIVRIETAGTTL